MAPFLKRLEIQGFKSFANKTSFDFQSKITGVVGPNGSGKSNVVDATRWVLGERAAKNLRGDSLENLIFAGTPKKPASSFARVTLVFDNRDKHFPVESEEVAIERKVDRSGLSQFFLNSSEIKLKDLLLIFARVKIGTRGLTIIGQGQSDLFVKSSPKERRFMIEEILGLKEFRIKKEEAENHLKNSRINMDKTKTAIEELEPHVKFLRRQKNRWDKKNEVENELQNIERKYYGFQARSILRDLKKIIEPLAELEEKKQSKTRNIRQLESELITPKEELADSSFLNKTRNEIEKFLSSKTSLEKEIVKIETKIELQGAAKNPKSLTPEDTKTKISELYEYLTSTLSLENIDEIKNQINRCIRIFEQILGKSNDTAVNHPESFEDIKKLKNELKSIEDKIRELKNEETGLIDKQQKHNQEFRLQVEKIENLKQELRLLENKIQEINFSREKQMIKLEELKRQWLNVGRTGESWAALENETDSLIEPNLAELERKITRFRGEIAAIGEIDDELMKEAENTEKRYEFLKKEYSDLENAITNLQNLINDLETRIDKEFRASFKKINESFCDYFGLMFGGGKARLKTVGDANDDLDPDSIPQETSGVEIEINIPRKKIKSLDMLSGGEKSLVSMASLFSLISVSNPPFLILDEIDAALDDENARRFSELIKNSSKNTQFIVITHNRITMEIADILYGITMGDDGVSKTLSLKLENHDNK